MAEQKKKREYTVKILNLTIDVSEAAALGDPAHIAVTVHLPDLDQLPNPTAVCFAKPGAGLTRHYFTADLPGPASGAQAEWQAARGVVFVSLDHLGVGESSVHEPCSRLDFATVVKANQAAEEAVFEQLKTGTLDKAFPALENALKIGIGHSMGACLTVKQQGHFHCYDGLAILGFSALYNRTPTLAGQDPIVAAWRIPAEGGAGHTVMLNEPVFVETYRKFHGKEPSPDDVLANRSEEANRWIYFYDDVLEHLAAHGAKPSPWLSATTPGLINCIMTPAIFASEAAAVDVPVLIAAAERDVIADLKGEPRAYLSTNSVDLFECPAMGHLHNFAGTRSLLWEKIDSWIQWLQRSRRMTSN